MAKLLTPMTAVKLGVGEAWHFLRPGIKEEKTVCGHPKCEECETKLVEEIKRGKFCKKCMGAMWLK